MLFSPCNKCLVRPVCNKEYYNCKMLQRYKEILEIVSFLSLLITIVLPLILAIIEFVWSGTITDTQFYTASIINFIIAVSIFFYCSNDVTERR